MIKINVIKDVNIVHRGVIFDDKNHQKSFRLH